MMTEERFLELYKQWGQENPAQSSMHRVDCPSFIELAAGGPELIPWALHMLSETIGKDSGPAIDWDNSPWLSILLIGVLSQMECYQPMTKSGSGYPGSKAGNLVELRKWILKWGKVKKLWEK